MSIQRVPNVPFAQIANQVLRDTRLTYRARGILAMVLSNVGEWEASRTWLVSMGAGEGRQAVQTALNELTELGYREVVKERQPNGQFKTVVLWFHFPQGQEGKEPVTRPPVTRPPVPPTVGWPDRPKTRPSKEEHYLKEHYVEENDKDSNDELFADGQVSSVTDLQPITKPVDPPGFTEFWETYPLRTAKPAARKAFIKAIKNTLSGTIIAGAENYANDPNRDPRYTAHAATWLNNERWNDDPIPSRSETPKSMQRTRDLMEWAAMEDQRLTEIMP